MSCQGACARAHVQCAHAHVHVRAHLNLDMRGACDPKNSNNSPFDKKLQKCYFIVTSHEQIMEFQAQEHNIDRLVTKDKQDIKRTF